MKTKFFLILTFIIFITACETNDYPNIDISEADLVGTWNLKSQVIKDGTLIVSIQDESISGNYSSIAEDIDFTWTFSKNPNKLDLQGKYNFIISMIFLGQTETEEQEINTDLIPIPSSSWSLNGNSITITEDNFGLPIMILNVMEFSPNYIRLEGEIDESETDNGYSITKKATLYIELEK